MPHLQLAHMVAVHPRGARLRKRIDRLARSVRPSLRSELAYRAALVAIVGECRQAGAAVVEEMRHEWNRRPLAHDAAAPAGAAQDASASPPGLDRAMEEAARRFGNIGAVANALALKTARRSLADVDDRLAASIRDSVSIDVSAAFVELTPGIRAAMIRTVDANIQLIKTIPQRYLAQVKQVVTDAWVSGLRWEDLSALVKARGDVADTRAWVIARDQTSKMNAAFNEARQTQVGIEEYDWNAIRDQRTRPSHWRMHGVRCKWRKPPIVDGESVNPGEPILCRCSAIPVIQLDPAAFAKYGEPVA